MTTTAAEPLSDDTLDYWAYVYASNYVAIAYNLTFDQFVDQVQRGRFYVRNNLLWRRL